jgi:ribosomal protein S7
MPRRREVPKREILPDPKFGNVEVAKFMNVLMLDGKKSVAERIVYGAFEHIEKKANKEPIEIFSSAMGNVKPMVEVKVAVLVVRTTKFQLKCVHRVVRLWPCAGCAKQRRSVVKNPWHNAWQTNC